MKSIYFTYTHFGIHIISPAGDKLISGCKDIQDGEGAILTKNYIPYNLQLVNA